MTAKNIASMAGSRSRSVFAWSISTCVRMLVTRNSGRARGTSWRSIDASASGFAPDVRTTNVLQPAGRGAADVKGKISDGADAESHVIAGASVANKSHDLKAELLDRCTQPSEYLYFRGSERLSESEKILRGARVERLNGEHRM
jgi:hypothetical protein